MSRTRRFPCDIVPPPETPPVAVSVVYDGPFSLATVTFDKPLVVQALNAANWVAMGTNPLTAVVTGTVPQSQVQLHFLFSMETPFDLEYLASPADVVGAPPNDLPVAAFTIPVV